METLKPDNNSKSQRSKKQENPLLNLGFNIIIPAVILMKGATWFSMGPAITLLIALLFPLGYGLYDLAVRKKYNALSILGLVSVLLTGGIGLLKLPKEWIAIKEAAVPLVIGMLVLGSLKTRYPLVKTFLYNDQILNLDKIDQALDERGARNDLETLLRRSTWLLAASFLLSALLNFILAKVIIQSETGTEAFTQELGKLTVWSYPMIALPCTVVIIYALWKLLVGLEKATGLPLEEIFVSGAHKKSK